jgi:hypothetical protein
MTKQSYHKPEFRIYGNISVMTQGTGSSGMYDNADNPRPNKKTS